MEAIQQFCLSLPGVTEAIKWDNLVFMVGDKIFCLADMEGDFGVTFKVTEEDFAMLTEIDGVGQAPYFARNKWVKVVKTTALDKQVLQRYLRQSYNLVIMGLSKKIRTQFGV